VFVRHCGVRRVGAWVVVLVVGFALVDAGTSPSPAAAASCVGSDVGIWGRSNPGNGIARGDQGDLVAKFDNPGACTHPGDLQVEGTSHMHVGISGSNDFAEIGWIDHETAGGGSALDLFWEYEVNGANSGAHIFSSGCASPGTTVTFRVGLKSGTTQWAMSYACHGGGFTQAQLSPALGENFGDARGEITTHTINPTPGNSLDESYSSLKYRNQSDSWVGWGAVGCQSIMVNPTLFNMHVGSSTAYTTGDFSSGQC
jgi:hypothetical protein